MERFGVHDLVEIHTRTPGGDKRFAAVVTNIEKVFSDPEGIVEWVFGYEHIDPMIGRHGASRIPMRGPYGTVDVKVLTPARRTA